MKKLSRLLLALGLALCISLTAYAEDAPAAQPTAKEPRTLRNGKPAMCFLR